MRTTTSADAETAAEEARLQMAELLWAMRKAPDTRSSVVHRGKKLLADPDYPSDEVIEAVARILASKLPKQTPE